MRLIVTLIILLFASNVFAAKGRIYTQIMTTGGAKSGNAIEINTGTSGQPQSQPAVAFFDDRFLVVYQEWNGSDLDVKAVRVDMSGNVLDTTPLTIASGARTRSLPDVAADTTGWMVVWQGWKAGSLMPRLFARRVPKTGTSLGTPLEFGDGDDLGAYPKIAYNATDDTFAVRHTISNHDRATYIGSTTTILTTTPTVDPSTTYDYTIGEAFSPLYYSIAANPSGGWTTIQSCQAASIYITRLCMAAIELDSDGGYSAGNYMSSGQALDTVLISDNTGFMDIENNHTEHTYGANAITNDVTYTIAVWQRWTLELSGTTTLNKIYKEGSIYGGRLNGSDLVETQGGTKIVGDTGINYQDPALAGNNSNDVLIVYTKTASGETQIGSKLIDTTSSISAGAEVIVRDATSGARRTNPDVAYGDDGGGTQEFMVVWTEGWWGTL